MANAKLNWIRQDGTVTEAPSRIYSPEASTDKWPYEYFATTTRGTEIFISQSKLTIEDARRILRCEVHTFEGLS